MMLRVATRPSSWSLPNPSLSRLAPGTRTTSVRPNSLRRGQPHHPQRLCGSSATQRSFYSSSSRLSQSSAAASSPVEGSQAQAQAQAQAAAHFPALAGAAHSGPIYEYDNRVQQGRLRSDDYQREIVGHLQDLHNALRTYAPKPVVHPPPPSAPAQSSIGSFFSSLLGGKDASDAPVQIPSDLPKGVYMFGDVGCGKTMLMDLFYDTLPESITSKKRVHFHNFMQDVHRRMHVAKMKYGQGGKVDCDVVPFVAAEIAEQSSVFCFDEFQCTDVADAMILRRLLENIMSHGVVLIMTSNRHPNDLYKDGVQRQSFIPCISLLKSQLTVLNLDSPTDYRKIPRPPSGVYHTTLDAAAPAHADKWFQYLGDFLHDPPHPASHTVWGRTVDVPRASGHAARFTFQELLGKATGAADYLELVKHYSAFVVTDVPAMTINQRDLARRFITFVDAVYEGRAKLVLTTAVPLPRLFLTDAELKIYEAANDAAVERDSAAMGAMRVGQKEQEMFAGDEERFAFSRALSRLVEMGSTEWVEQDRGY